MRGYKCKHKHTMGVMHNGLERLHCLTREQGNRIAWAIRSSSLPCVTPRWERCKNELYYKCCRYTVNKDLLKKKQTNKRIKQKQWYVYNAGPSHPTWSSWERRACCGKHATNISTRTSFLHRKQNKTTTKNMKKAKRLGSMHYGIPGMQPIAVDRAIMATLATSSLAVQA